jgi:hypothetical protein
MTLICVEDKRPESERDKPSWMYVCSRIGHFIEFDDDGRGLCVCCLRVFVKEEEQP